MPHVIAVIPVLQQLIDVAESILKFFHDKLGLGWGVSIIALTVVVRAALLPLTLRQAKSMQALQRLAPEMKELQARHKDDRQRLNEEMMKFYRENKVNPLGSCLPLVAQFPVFIALFYMLRRDLRMDICGQVAKPCGEVAKNGGEKFLFIPDITNKAMGATLVVLILLYVGSQLASSLLTPVPDPKQKRLMVALPLVFVPFIISGGFPAGLLVYWITTNLWTVAQQQYVRRTVGPIVPPAAAKEQSGGAKSSNGKAEDGKVPRSATPAKPPPPSPRKKKKQRSGRRR